MKNSFLFTLRKYQIKKTKKMKNKYKHLKSCKITKKNILSKLNYLKWELQHKMHNNILISNE